MNKVYNILFNGHDFRFLRPVINHFKHHPNYRVYLDEHPGHVILNTRKSADLSENANIIFCEWCLGNAEWYSYHKKRNQKLMIRLHHQELDLPYLEKICWENVDEIIFICQNNLRVFVERYPELSDKARIIYNPINCDSFNMPKIYGAEFNIGLIGLSPKRKSPHLAIDILKRLKKADRRFTLYFKGKLPWEYDWLWRRPEERTYYNDFLFQIEHSDYKNSIVFENYGDDMPEWFSKIGFLLSTSDHEGSHQAVAEGMAAGSIPVIRNWTGAELLYPRKFIFRSVDEAVELLLKSKTPEHYKRETHQVKDYAYDNFDKTKILPEYEQLFEHLLKSNVETKALGLVGKEYPKVSAVITDSTDCDLTVMHVCYINPHSQDGYATRVMEETHVLKKAGVRIIIACFVHRDYFSRPDQLYEHLKMLRDYTGAYVHLIPADDFFNLSAISNGCEDITSPIVDLATFYNVDIIHGQSIYSTLYAMQANKQIKAKLVFDVHGIAPEEAEMCGEHPRRVSALRKWEDDILKLADLIVFVSNHMKDYYTDKYNLSFSNSIIIPTCVLSKRFVSTLELRNKKRNELGLDGKFLVSYLGTLSQWQWPEGLFSVFSHIYRKRSDSLFYLLIPKSDHEKSLKLFEAHDIPPESYHIQEAPHTEVGSLIGVADVGLLIRKNHLVNYVSSPTKFGEYVAAGVPVIATENIGDISEIIEKENLGLVLSLDGEYLKASDLDNISLFLEDVQINRRLWSDRCAHYGKAKLDWAFYGPVLRDAYAKLVVDKE